MTANEDADLERWEQACLHALEAMLRRLVGTKEELPVDNVRLEGSFPDTQIVATFAPGAAAGGTKGYRLWGEALAGPDGGRTTPDDAAVLIYTWLSGG